MAEADPIRVGVRELRSNLGDFLRRASEGTRFLIVSRGAPVAELGAPPQKPALKPRQSGLMKGQFWMADDFDEWPPDILESFGKPL